MHRILGMAALFFVATAMPAAAQTGAAKTTATDQSVGGWGEAQKPRDEAIERSRLGVTANSGLFGGRDFKFMFVPLGLIMVIGRLVIAHFLRQTPKGDEKVYEYHEPPVHKWQPRDPQAEARMRILEPDLIVDEEPAAMPMPAPRPARSFGRRGL